MFNSDKSVLAESEDEDIFAQIDLDAISDPIPSLVYLDCGKDCSNYDDWTAEKSFLNVFPVDEECLHDPEIRLNLFQAARQTILEMKLLGQDQLPMRLSVTNLLHFVYSEGCAMKFEKEVEIIRDILENRKFIPNSQDNKEYTHGYFEWRLLLALIAIKQGLPAGHVKDLFDDLVFYSINAIGVRWR